MDKISAVETVRRWKRRIWKGRKENEQNGNKRKRAEWKGSSRLEKLILVEVIKLREHAFSETSRKKKREGSHLVLKLERTLNIFFCVSHYCFLCSLCYFLQHETDRIGPEGGVLQTAR